MAEGEKKRGSPSSSLSHPITLYITFLSSSPSLSF